MKTKGIGFENASAHTKNIIVLHTLNKIQCSDYDKNK